MKSSKAARVSRAARKPSSRAALAVDRVRPQRSRSSSWGERKAMPALRMATAARPSPRGGSSGACSLPAESSSVDSGSLPAGAMLYAPPGPRLVARTIASMQSSRWMSWTGGAVPITAGTAREQVQGADDVHLVRSRRVHIEGVDTRQRVHDRVDTHRADELADERVADVELQVIRAAEVVARLPDVDPDDVRDVGIFRQALHHQRAPPARHPSDEDPPSL